MKNRFSYFFVIVMIVLALGMIFIGDDDPDAASDTVEATLSEESSELKEK